MALTPKGLSRAKNVCFKYESLKGKQKHKDETITAGVRITPHVSVTLDNNASQRVHSSQTPIATDVAEPPMRVQTETYRILRDTKLAREVKESDMFRCQICSNPPLKLSNVNFYAEAHHIKPLGSPHDGPDVRENIICVCPNCHVLLDYGAIKLDQQGATSNHTIGHEYVDYHNDHIYTKFEIKP